MLLHHCPHPPKVESLTEYTDLDILLLYQLSPKTHQSHCLTVFHKGILFRGRLYLSCINVQSSFFVGEQLTWLFAL